MTQMQSNVYLETNTTSTKSFFNGQIQDLNSLDGIQLKIVAFEDKDYIHRMKILKYENGSLEFVNGMCYELLLALQTSLKFSYKPVEGLTWIGKHPNGSLVGMPVQVLYDEADLSIAQASQVMLQMPGHFDKGFTGINFISYLHPTSAMTLTAMFRQPDASSARDILMSTFTFKMWIGWLIIWGIIFLSFLFINYAIKRRHSSAKIYFFDDEEYDYKTNLSFSYGMMWCFSQIACQGWHENPKEISIKGIFLASMIFAHLINTFFSAALTSNLATETISIKTFHDLTLSHLKIYGDKRLPVVHNIVKEVYKERKNVKLNRNGQPDLPSNYIRLINSTNVIRKEAAAFITFEDAAKSVFQRQGYSDQYFCEKISSLSVTSRSFPNAMFVKKGSYLREVFNRKILLAIECGIVFRINLRYTIGTVVSCPVISQNYRGGLGVVDVSSAFWFVFFGILLSCVALLCEKLIDIVQFRIL